MAQYAKIRSKEQAARCVGPMEMALYCACGCQSPQADDPDLDAALADVDVAGSADHGYADVTLTRGGVRVGEVNTQYAAILLDGREYLGCTGTQVTRLLQAARAALSTPRSTPVPYTNREAAAINRLIAQAEQRDNPYMRVDPTKPCSICGSYCYGDCAS